VRPEKDPHDQANLYCEVKGCGCGKDHVAVSVENGAWWPTGYFCLGGIVRRRAMVTSLVIRIRGTPHTMTSSFTHW
jgi:hypothetical protein